MAFNKFIYLLEALLPAGRESVSDSHVKRRVTGIRILLYRDDFYPVTVSNLVKLHPDN